MDESEFPPALSHQMLPKLLGITPCYQPNPSRFAPQKYSSTVTAATSEADWLKRQGEIRVRLSEL